MCLLSLYKEGCKQLDTDDEEVYIVICWFWKLKASPELEPEALDEAEILRWEWRPLLETHVCNCNVPVPAYVLNHCSSIVCLKKQSVLL